MSLQRPVPASGPAIEACGPPSEVGWIRLPAGWHPGDPADPVQLARAVESVRTGEADGSGLMGPPLLLPALLLVALLSAAAGVRRRRRRRGPAAVAGPGDTTVSDGSGPSADEADDPAPTTAAGGRDGAPQEPRPTPIRTRPAQPSGEPIVVTLGRPASRKSATPVRLPPHVAAALTRSRSSGGSPPSSPETPRPSPAEDRPGSPPVRDPDADPDGRRHPERAGEEGDESAPDGEAPRRRQTGNSWLIAD